MNASETFAGGSTHRLSRRSFVGGALASAALLAASLPLMPTVHAASATVIWRGGTSVANVALTFDCGSDRGYVDSILTTLSSKGVKATFGVTGQFAAAYPDAVKRMATDGHDIMNHTYSHPSFTGLSWPNPVLSTSGRQQELQSADNAIASACGRSSKPFFRPAFGDYDASVLADVGAIGYTYCILWTLDVLGWNGLTKEQVINRALSNHGNGYIYLMHVGGQSQEGPALPTIIDGLRERGYGFVRLSQMLGVSPNPPASGGFKAGDVVSVTAGLYLRTGPGLAYSVITTMPTGTKGTIVGGPTPSGGYTWYQLKTPYGTGWAAGEYLALVTAAPAPTPTPTPTGYAPGTKLKVTAGLWLRTAGNLGASVITTMPTGTIVTVVSGPSPSGGLTWYQVDTPYGRGWAAGEYLTPTSATPTPTPAPTPTPSPAPTGWAPGTTVKVTAGLWLRTAGNLNGSVIATMPTGTICTVVSGPAPSGGLTWYQLDTPYGRGWAAGEYLVPVTSTPTPPATTGYPPGTKLKVTAGLWLRTAGNLSGSVIATMPTGTIVTVVSGPIPSGGLTWYQVDTPYGRGWAAGEYLVPV